MAGEILIPLEANRNGGPTTCPSGQVGVGIKSQRGIVKEAVLPEWAITDMNRGHKEVSD